MPRVAPERLAQARGLARAWLRLQEETTRLRPDGSAEPGVPGAAEAEPETDELAAAERRMDALCRRAAALEGATPLRQSAPLQALARALAAELDPERQPPPPCDATPAEAPAPAVPPSDVPCADVSPPDVSPSEIASSEIASSEIAPSGMPPADMPPSGMPPCDMPRAEMSPPVAAHAPAAGPMAKGSVRPVPPPRGARRRVVGAAIGLGVVLLVVGAALSDRSIVPVPAVGRPGPPAATQAPGISGHAAAAAGVGAGPGRDLGRFVGAAVGGGTSAVAPSRHGVPVGGAGRSVPVVAVPVVAAPVVAVASAGSRDGAPRPGRAVAEPLVQRAAPAAVVVRAIATAWIGARAPNGHLVFSRVLHAGDSWTPPHPGLSLTTGNAGGIELVVNGVAGPPLGASGTVLHEIPLDPADLATWTAGAARRGEAAPRSRRGHAPTSVRYHRKGARG